MNYPALTAQAFNEHLHTPHLSVNVVAQANSTQMLLRQDAEAGAPEGSVLVAEEQTQGRGRLGRSFFSPKECGLYFSVLLRPSVSLEQAQALTPLAAVALCRGIERICKIDAQIKWVNDIYLDKRKVGGILCECVTDASGNLNYVLLGVGVNIFPSQTGFPAEIDQKAGCLFSAAPQTDCRPLLCAAFLEEFFLYYPQLDAKLFWQEYKNRLFILEEKVTVTQGNSQFDAYVLDLTKDFHLKVLKTNGDITLLSNGEISLII